MALRSARRVRREECGAEDCGVRWQEPTLTNQGWGTLKFICQVMEQEDLR